MLSSSTVALFKTPFKVLAVVVSSFAQLVAEFVKIFGAVAKYTFIVQPKKLKVSLKKANLLFVDAKETTVSVVRNRIQIVTKYFK